MIGGWQEGLLIFFRTINQIVMAGIAITAFSLLLYALTFNLRDRVARLFAAIMICVVIVYTTETMSSTTQIAWQVDIWLRLRWIGIILLPAIYLHFSDALLAITGKTSRWRRFWAVRIVYLISLVFLVQLARGHFIGALQPDALPVAYLEPTWVARTFISYYVTVMGVSWFNFWRAYRRTTTPTSRRRMAYLIGGALAPAMAAFPFMLFGSTIATAYPTILWGVAATSNLVYSVLMVVMAYSVAFFGVPWPDRVVKSRLFKWILRGPVIASFTLALTTIVRRLGESFGAGYTALVPITMVSTVLIGQYLITILGSFWEKWLFFGGDRQELTLIRFLEQHLLTRNDLAQFMEMILAAVRDRLQAGGAYVAALDGENLELVFTTGKTNFDDRAVSDQLSRLTGGDDRRENLFRWGDDYLVPLIYTTASGESNLQGLLGVSGVGAKTLDSEELEALAVLAKRAALALFDRRTQQTVFRSFEDMAPNFETIQRIRAAGRYDGATLLQEEIPSVSVDVFQWVKEALSHYWGGPKLTKSPLLDLKVVQESLHSHEGNHANALRSVLRQAVERVKPEGDRRFTAEWILYNIIDMKFLEGKKVREVALRLAMSEADLYRKQKVAIEAVARAILDMEAKTRNHVTDEMPSLGEGSHGGR